MVDLREVESLCLKNCPSDIYKRNTVDMTTVSCVLRRNRNSYKSLLRYRASYFTKNISADIDKLDRPSTSSGFGLTILLGSDSICHTNVLANAG